MKAFDTLAKRGQLDRLRKLALNALAEYELPDPSLRPLNHGDNTTFRVDSPDAGPHVLRVHRPTLKRAAEIRSEMMWLSALSREGLEVPRPVLTRGGDLLSVAGAEGVPEPRTCVLFGWLEGEFLDEELTPDHLAQVGAFTARLQQHGARFKAPEGFLRGRLDNLWGKPRGVSEAFARSQTGDPEDESAALEALRQVATPEDVEAVEQLIRKIRAAQAELGRGPDAFGLIHGDLHQENYFFHQGRVRAIDFDDCGYGHYLYDLSVTLFNLEEHENFPALKAALLEGYRKVRPLPTAHEAYLEVFAHLRELQMMLWVIEMRDHPEFRQTWEADVRASLGYIQRALEG